MVIASPAGRGARGVVKPRARAGGRYYEDCAPAAIGGNAEDGAPTCAEVATCVAYYRWIDLAHTMDLLHYTTLMSPQAAGAPHNPVSRPSFSRVTPGMRSIPPHKWQRGKSVFHA